MQKLTGKVALVTGASRGIGFAISQGLAREGARLVLTGRNAASLSAAAERLAAAFPLTNPPERIVADLTEEADVLRLFSEIESRCGRLDLLVNNAGAFDGGPLDEFSTAAWDRVLAVNLRGPFLCTREALKLMKRQRGGRIINIGSISAQRVRPESAAYSASKHGLWGLTQVTALEGREYGVTCGCLHPGNTAVERRQAEVDEEAEPMMEAEELARVAVLMATLPPHVALLEAVVLPRDQQYIGRG